MYRMAKQFKRARAFDNLRNSVEKRMNGFYPFANHSLMEEKHLYVMCVNQAVDAYDPIGLMTYDSEWDEYWPDSTDFDSDGCPLPSVLDQWWEAYLNELMEDLAAIYGVVYAPLTVSVVPDIGGAVVVTVYSSTGQAIISFIAGFVGNYTPGPFSPSNWWEVWGWGAGKGCECGDVWGKVKEWWNQVWSQF